MDPPAVVFSLQECPPSPPPNVASHSFVKLDPNHNEDSSYMGKNFAKTWKTWGTQIKISIKLFVWIWNETEWRKISYGWTSLPYFYLLCHNVVLLGTADIVELVLIKLVNVSLSNRFIYDAILAQFLYLTLNSIIWENTFF